MIATAPSTIGPTILHPGPTRAMTDSAVHAHKINESDHRRFGRHATLPGADGTCTTSGGNTIITFTLSGSRFARADWYGYISLLLRSALRAGLNKINAFRQSSVDFGDAQAFGREPT